MPHAEKSLEVKITEWLGTQGYPLEMQVARSFRDARFQVVQSEFYMDPVSDESREIDVVAYRSGGLQGRSLEVTVPVECKRSKNKPWIVFTDATIRIDDSMRVSHRDANGLGRKFLQALAQDRALSDIGLFGLPREIGYSITQAFTERRDRAYEALMGVTSAARGLASSLKDTGTTAVYFPVLVLEGRLFEASLNRDNTVDTREVDRSVVVWRRAHGPTPFRIVDVVNPRGLEKFIDLAEVTSDALFGEETVLAEAVGRPHARKRRIISQGIDR